MDDKFLKSINDECLIRDNEALKCGYNWVIIDKWAENTCNLSWDYDNNINNPFDRSKYL